MLCGPLYRFPARNLQRPQDKERLLSSFSGPDRFREVKQLAQGHTAVRDTVGLLTPKPVLLFTLQRGWEDPVCGRTLVPTLPEPELMVTGRVQLKGLWSEFGGWGKMKGMPNPGGRELPHQAWVSFWILSMLSGHRPAGAHPESNEPGFTSPLREVDTMGNWGCSRTGGF